jgi:hypothetical protein
MSTILEAPFGSCTGFDVSVRLLLRRSRFWSADVLATPPYSACAPSAAEHIYTSGFFSVSR